jgi:hypothetical protein
MNMKVIPPGGPDRNKTSVENATEKSSLPPEVVQAIETLKNPNADPKAVDGALKILQSKIKDPATRQALKNNFMQKPGDYWNPGVEKNREALKKNMQDALQKAQKEKNDSLMKVIQLMMEELKRLVDIDFK